MQKLVQKLLIFFGEDPPEKYFMEECYWSQYKVFARHGDKYDKFNYDGDRRRSSLGDAIVIDLINRFQRELNSIYLSYRNPYNEEAFRKLLNDMKNIDDVRPVTDVPIWILAATLR